MQTSYFVLCAILFNNHSIVPKKADVPSVKTLPTPCAAAADATGPTGRQKLKAA